ncbi:hypothetical protein EGW08_000344, partial [Elysia chlorotica]
MTQLQAQGNLQNTDALASAIAHYLKSHLSSGIAPTSNDLPQTHVQNNQNSTFNHPSFLGSQSQHMLAPQSMGFSSFPNNASTIPSSATSITMSTYSSSASSPMYSFNPNLTASYSPGTLPTQQNTSQSSGHFTTTSMAQVMGHYPAPYPGLGQMPVQFTLVQDPATGLMQMVPCVMPLSSQSQPYTTQLVPELSTQHTSTGYSSNQQESQTVSTSNANPLNKEVGKITLPVNAQNAISPQAQINPVDASHSTHITPAPLQSTPGDNKERTNSSSSKVDDHSGSTAPRHLDPVSKSTLAPNNAGNGVDSQSSSPSPSKDSGICVSQQAQAATYSKDPLMERLLSSHDSHRQRTLSHVLRIIREEFADDGVFDSGVEDLAIAEYILSLTSLTWDTFRCAITEKFFHLVWTYDLLAVLYEAIGGSPSPQFRNFPQTPPLLQGGKANVDSKYLPQSNSKPPSSNTRDLQTNQQTPSPRTNFLQPESSQRPTASDGSGMATRASPYIPAAGYKLPPRGVGNYLQHQRPRSEVGRLRGVWSETSDSTDTEARDKKRRFKKRGDLDKNKSSSLHNISVGMNGFDQQDDIRHGNSNTLEKPMITSHAYEDPRIDSLVTHNDLHRAQPIQAHPYSNNECPGSTPGAENHLQSFQSHGVKSHHFSSSATHTPVLRASDYNSHIRRTNDLKEANIGSQSSSKSGTSFEHFQGHKSQTSPRETQGGVSPRVPNILPSKPSNPRSNQYPASHLLPSRDYAGSSSSSSPNDQQPGRLQHQPISQDFSVHSTRSNKVFSSPHSANDEDSDLDRSAEMRRLAAQKPELFHDTRSSKGLFAQEKSSSKHTSGLQSSHSTNVGSSNGTSALNSTLGGQKSNYEHSNFPQAPSTSNFPNASNRYSVPDHAAGNRLGNALAGPSKNNYFTNSMSAIPSYEPSTAASKTRNDHLSLHNNSNLNYGNNSVSRNNGTNHFNNHNNPGSTPQYGRSLSAVYTRRHQPLETGVMVTDDTSDPFGESQQHGKGHHRRGSDGSVHLPEINSALLPYNNKGQIVYHSAMIQLSLTSEVDEFIHSIDEENKRAIDLRLTSVKQEITVQLRQRKKTQRFYRKLNEQNTDGKTSKGDQAISDQMLKDMTEMTRKISFLQLCQTHLQMLLAELYGLDSCFLYSLAAAEPGQPLVLQPIVENQYLQ